MNELKAFDIVVAEEGNGEGIVKYRRAVYDKAEVDKVISELKADYKEACDRLQTANLIKDEQLAAARHHKYKRCLRNAEGCLYKSWYYDEAHDRNASSRMWKWRQRWLELAEKFKEVK